MNRAPNVLTLALFLALFMFVGEVKPVLAVITNPYTVDEKPQVLFGDSTPFSSYYGLENYTHDFVNEYLHITFTYTHSRCCSASFPPSLYVTSIDPRATTTPTVKLLSALYVLLPIPIPPGHETDWYGYDIQFDATGYSIVVKEAGVTEVINEHREVVGLVEGDWVALVNNYPNIGIHSMAFTPVPIKSNEPERTPVIIIPGIMASYLNKEDGTEVWMNIPKMVLPGDDLYLDELSLSSNGEPVDDSFIKVGEIVKETSSEDFFMGLINSLLLKGYIEGVDLFVFPYDWRVDISSLTSNLDEKIKEIKDLTDSQNVDVIAHSMGGLLAKEYFKQYSGDNIGKFIDIGTPHEGSPKAFKILGYGDNLNASVLFGLIGLSVDRVKAISQNMPSVYQLLPSQAYGSYLYDLDDFDGNAIRGLLSYSDTKEFMKNTGRNSLLVDRAGTFHQGIDNLNPADYGIDTYNIVGCGVETLGKIFVLNKEASGGVEYNISFTNGDGTVPLKSAESIPSLQTYYAKNAIHATMPSTTGIKELITQILSSTSTANIDISSYTNMATSATDCAMPNGRIVSFHSPIDLHIYDISGDHHAGPNIDGDIENNLPGVSYEVIDGNKFAFLPDGTEYVVSGVATASGTFNARVETIQNEIVTETKYYNAVPLTSTTEVELHEDTIVLDTNGDGTVVTEVAPSAVLDQTQSGDIVKPITVHSTNPTGKKDGKFDKPVKIILTATDDNSGVLKTDYSTDNGITWLIYTSPFTVGTKGENKVLYKSTDRAGNVEFLKSVTITINPPGNSGRK